jgi:hypothetical protein
MATNTTAPSQPVNNDAEARMRVFQIIGSDIYDGAPAAFTGDWHQALKTTAARWASEAPEYTWRTRLTFQAHGLFRAVRNTAQAIHHLSTNPIATTAGIALAVFLWLAAPITVAAAFTPVGLYLGLAWAIDGNEKTCPICRHNHRTETAA